MPLPAADELIRLRTEEFARGETSLGEFALHVDRLLGLGRPSRPPQEAVDAGAEALARADGSSWAELGAGQRDRARRLAEACIDAALPLLV